MDKKDRQKLLFKLKVLAICGAAAFMADSVNCLYAEQKDIVEKEKGYQEWIRKDTVTVEPSSTVVVKHKENIVLENGTSEKFQKCQSIYADINFSNDEAHMLARIAMAEAESEGIKGKALVIMVVLNRVLSDNFPDSISEVIFQKDQFSPVSNGRYDKVVPDKECYKALELVQKRKWDKSQGALYFESESNSDWHKNNLEFLFQYKRHYFYTDKELEE